MCNEFKYPISVVMVTYQSKWMDLYRTILSIISQKDIDYDLVIADDDSDEDWFNEIDALFFDIGFSNYTLIKNKKNTGTVENLFNGVNQADGKYIRGISPGDLFYDDYTLRDIYQFMEEKGAEICFGDYVPYSVNGKGKPEAVRTQLAPKQLKTYTKEPYSYNRVKHSYLVCGNNICGVSLCWGKKCLLRFLTTIVGKVIYMEDGGVLKQAIAENIKIWYFRRYLCWYEYGTGISTASDVERRKYYGEKLRKDEWESYSMLIKEYPASHIIIRAYLLNRTGKINMKLIRRVLRIIIAPELIYWRFKKRYPEDDVDLSLLRRYYECTFLEEKEVC